MEMELHRTRYCMNIQAAALFKDCKTGGRSVLSALKVISFEQSEASVRRKGELAIQQQAIGSPGLAERYSIFGHSFTSRDTHVKDKSMV